MRSTVAGARRPAVAQGVWANRPIPPTVEDGEGCSSRRGQAPPAKPIDRRRRLLAMPASPGPARSLTAGRSHSLRRQDRDVTHGNCGVDQRGVAARAAAGQAAAPAAGSAAGPPVCRPGHDHHPGVSHLAGGFWLLRQPAPVAGALPQFSRPGSIRAGAGQRGLCAGLCPVRAAGLRRVPYPARRAAPDGGRSGDFLSVPAAGLRPGGGDDRPGARFRHRPDRADPDRAGSAGFGRRAATLLHPALPETVFGGALQPQSLAILADGLAGAGAVRLHRQRDSARFGAGV